MMRWLLPVTAALALVFSGCSQVRDLGEKPTAGSAPEMADPWKPPPLDRVWRALRANPPFVSALMLVDAGPPPKAFADDYFDGFHGTVVQFWEAGLPRQLADWEAVGRPGMRFLSWVDKDGTSRDGGKVLGGIGPNRPGRVGFQIGDEPGVKGANFAGVLPFRRGVEAVRAADPRALVVMNFSPLVTDASRILDYAGATLGIDVFSFDRYNLGNRQYESLGLIRRYARKYHRPYWRYLYGYRRDGKDRLTPSDLRWDAMAGLVYGFTGFTWFIYQNNTMEIAPAFFRRPGYGGAKSPLWQAAADINRDLGAYLRVTTHLWSTDVRYRALLPPLQPAGTQPWQRGAGGDPYLADLSPADDADSSGMEILAGFFRDDAGEHYVMLQNVRHTGGSPPNDNEVSGTIRVRFDFNGAGRDLDPTRILVFDPETGLGLDKPLEKHGNGGGVARFRVDAGDVVLFKYVTGRPFAGH